MITSNYHLHTLLVLGGMHNLANIERTLSGHLIHLHLYNALNQYYLALMQTDTYQCRCYITRRYLNRPILKAGG